MITGAAAENENVYVNLDHFTKNVPSIMKNYPTDDGSIEMGLTTAIGHEVAHSNSYLRKLGYIDKYWYTSQNGKAINQDEWYATVVENYIRIDQNMPLRTHYGYRDSQSSKVKLPDENSRVIQPANNYEFMLKAFNIGSFEVTNPN